MVADALSSHDIDYVEYVGPGLTWRRVSSTCVISMCSNDIKCKYMFMLPLQNLEHKVSLSYKMIIFVRLAMLGRYERLMKVQKVD